MNDITTRYEREALHFGPDQDDPTFNTNERRRPRSRLRIIAICSTVVIVAGGGFGAYLWQQNSASAAPKPTAPAAAEVPVMKGSVIVETSAAGTLQHSAQRTLTSGPSGIVTSLLPVGAAVKPGEALYTVDARPVMLLAGPVPAWRTFEAGMSRGEDVRQLEANLAAFGLFRGDVDTEFTGLTTQAIRAWQKSIGTEQSGIIERSAIMFADSDIRIAEQKSSVGANVGEGAELYLISSLEKSVSVQLNLNDQKLAVLDAPVTIALPTGTETTGVVSSIGAPMEQAGADPNAPKGVVLPVTVTLTDPAAAADFSRASVTVRFSSTLSADALTVPVEALLAVDDQTFAVETQNAGNEKPRQRIVVTTGAFGSGRVEISGDGIAEGLRVVVPTR